MFEDKDYKIYGLFGPGDKLVGLYVTKEAAIQDKNARNRMAVTEMGLPLGLSARELEDKLDDAGYVVGEMGFDSSEVNFL